MGRIVDPLPVTETDGRTPLKADPILAEESTNPGSEGAPLLAYKNVSPCADSFKHGRRGKDKGFTRRTTPSLDSIVRVGSSA
jgi:hypothetical protein